MKRNYVACVARVVLRRQLKVKKDLLSCTKWIALSSDKKGSTRTKLDAKDTERQRREKERRLSARGEDTRYIPTTRIMHKCGIGPHYQHAAACRLISRVTASVQTRLHANVNSPRYSRCSRDGRGDRSDSVLMSERERRHMDGGQSRGISANVYIA